MRALGLAGGCAVLLSTSALAETADVVQGHVLVSPVALVLVLDPSTANVGQWVAGRVTVQNVGPTTVGKVSVRLRTPSGIVVRPAAARSVGRLGPGSSTSLSWSLCGQQPGTYLLFAEATLGSAVVESAARLLTVTPGSGDCGPGRSGHQPGA